MYVLNVNENLKNNQHNLIDHQILMVNMCLSISVNPSWAVSISNSGSHPHTLQPPPSFLTLKSSRPLFLRKPRMGHHPGYMQIYTFLSTADQRIFETFLLATS